MKIIVEMIFKHKDGASMRFSETYGPNGFNPVRIAYPLVRGKMREFYDAVEIFEVKVNGEDVTERILKVHKVYDRKLFDKYEDQLPF
ncbi:hypothetical protein [Lederbergia citri]|uniref:Uncharacterized protein n=1 Tax=Lederbergia citri TaxID=2833580 RepID=A0A942TBW3_9BACI|nr:hypothetical protein [Lederbergia citri]MBS4193469.1 hypothetical protein [Lederbergia citri]